MNHGRALAPRALAALLSLIAFTRTVRSGAAPGAQADAVQAPGGSSAGASVSGKVALPKSPAAPVMVSRYEIVSTHGILAPYPPLAVVYVDGPFARPAAPAVASMAQKDLAFRPALLPVQAGTRVEFPNLDDTYHNIFSFSAAKRFDLGRYRSDERPIPSEVFDTPGLVTLRCDIHEHMRALILVLETPYFVVTDTAGRYSLRGVPPGRHVLKAWIDSRTTLSRTVELREGAVSEADFP
jgi:plastocyanin